MKIKAFNSKTGDFQEKILPPIKNIQTECLIGRHPSCDLVLNCSRVSGVHGRIYFQKGQSYFTDFASTNGSRFNNEEVEVNQNYIIRKNDIIRIEEYLIWVEEEELDGNVTDVETSQISLWTQSDIAVRCVRSIQETDDVKTFVFTSIPPILFTYKPGQFVTLNLEINGEQVSRCYSISSAPSRPYSLEITVKRVSGGLVSNWLHDNIKVGSELKLSSPMGTFTCCDNPAQKLLLISAGSGITPMMSMARWICDTATEIDVVFFYSARRVNDIIFRQELELMAARYPNFKPVVTITKPEPGFTWLGYTGRLTKAMLHSVAADFRDRTVYVCGPDSFMQEVEAMLERLGFPMQNYYSESFGSPKKDTLAPKQSHLASSLSSQVAVDFRLSGKQVSTDGSESILDLALEAGIKIPLGCRSGKCGACKQRKLEGEVRLAEYNPHVLSPSELEAGLILSCVAYPLGQVAIDV